MEVISYSDNIFLNYGVKEILRFSSSEPHQYKINNAPIDSIIILNDLDIRQTIDALKTESARFLYQHVMVLTETVSPLIVGYLLRKCRGLVVYSIKNNVSHVLIDVQSREPRKEIEQAHYFSLSDNELFILLSLSMGMKPELLTRITGRSEKRVSAIKRDAMNQLNIKNSHIFYDVIKAIFIPQGGAAPCKKHKLTSEILSVSGR